MSIHSSTSRLRVSWDGNGIRIRYNAFCLAEYRWWSPELYILERHIHHFWMGLVWALTDWPDRHLWWKDLRHARSRGNSAIRR